jgi:hypothetical protein
MVSYHDTERQNVNSNTSKPGPLMNLDGRAGLFICDRAAAAPLGPSPRADHLPMVSQDYFCFLYLKINLQFSCE